MSNKKERRRIVKELLDVTDKEFTDEEGCHCLIFKFKKGLFSPWLMAIHSDSGIFSEQERYDENNDIEQATQMLTYLKQYWNCLLYTSPSPRDTR